jgi:cell division protein FtsB
MGRKLNENPGEYVAEGVAEKDAEIARLKQENADLQAHVDNLKDKLDACLAQLPPASA